MSISADFEEILPGRDKHVVLYDRDQTILLVLRHLLKKLGFSVSVVSDPAKGMSLITAEQPQLLIWSLHRQPDIDFHMLQEVQRLDSRPYVILVSTPETLSVDAPINTLESGDVFIKPFEPSHLMRRIRYLLKQQKI